MGYIILLLSILCHGSSLKQLHIVMVEGYPWHPPVGHGGFQPPLSSDPFNPGTHPARCPWCNVAILSLSHYVYPSMHHSKHHLPSHLPFIDINIMSHQLTLCLCLKFWNISESFHFFPPFIYSPYAYVWSFGTFLNLSIFSHLLSTQLIYIPYIPTHQIHLSIVSWLVNLPRPPPEIRV